MIKNHPAVSTQFKVDAKDREYQFWERNALSIELNTSEMLKQKLEYIHYNPVEAGLCNLPEEYKYSTARFYETVQRRHWKKQRHHSNLLTELSLNMHRVGL